MTQVQVAKVMGVTQRWISQIERGGVRLGTSTMSAYLQAIGVARAPCGTRTIGKNGDGQHEESVWRLRVDSWSGPDI